MELVVFAFGATLVGVLAVRWGVDSTEVIPDEHLYSSS